MLIMLTLLIHFHTVLLLTVPLVVEQSGQFVSKLKHLHILNCLFAAMRLKYKSSHNPYHNLLVLT